MKFFLKGYFTVYNHVYLNLYLRLEAMGYFIPDVGKDGSRIRPHKSVGYWFQKYLGEKYPEKKNSYMQVSFLDDSGKIDNDYYGNYHYSNELLSIYTGFFENTWLPQKAKDYFKKKDTNILRYLPELVNADDREPGSLKGERFYEVRRAEERLQTEIRTTIRNHMKGK